MSISRGKRRLQVLVTTDQERRIREAAAADGSEEDISGWVREAALTRASGLLDPLTADTELVEELRTYVAEHLVKLRNIETLVRFKLFTRANHTGVWWEQSHYVRTPLQREPYKTSLPRGDDLQHAFRRALTGLTSFIDMAVREGEQATTKWLVINDSFTR